MPTKKQIITNDVCNNGDLLDFYEERVARNTIAILKFLDLRHCGCLM